jgi:hypothetical protein
MAELDAEQILKSMLSGVGLSDLAAVVWAAYGEGKITEQTTIDQIGFQIKETESYKKRFAGNVALEKANKAPFSISNYLQQEQAYKNAIQGRGLPAGFYDTPEAFAKFIGSEISPQEVANRVDQGYLAVKDANPEVLAQLKQYYPDVNTGDIAAYFMDPTVGTDIIVNRAKVAEIGSEAKRQAGINLSEEEAQALRKEGIDKAGAQRGFGSIALQQEIFNPIAQGEEAISQSEQIGATFGTNVAAAQRIAKRKRERSAAFEEGGGFAKTNQFGTEGLRTVGQ